MFSIVMSDQLKSFEENKERKEVHELGVLSLQHFANLAVIGVVVRGRP